MANTVIALKKSGTTSSVPSNLANGELAINYADGKLYYKAANGTIASISGNEPNYFGSVSANGTLIVSDVPGDILTLETGNNISIVGDAINDKVTIGLTNDVTLPGVLTLGAAGGDEGGELKLANALTNSVLSGKVVIDIYQNKLRFYEEAGTNRGAFIDLSAASGGVATNLLASSGSVDSTARQWATGAFDKANNAYAQANAAYDAANNTVTDFSPAFNQANLAYAQANAAFNAANNAVTDYSPALIQANTARVHANAAFASANAGQATANAAFNKANNALANTTGTFNGTLTISSDLIALKNVVFGAAGSAFSPRIYSYDNNGIYFYGANTEHSAIRYSTFLGSALGIGTSNPSWTITAYGGGTMSGLDYVNIAAYYGGNTTGHNASRMVLTADSTGTYIDTEFDRDFSIRTGYYQDRIKVTYDGKVGINNSSPTANLDVTGGLVVSDAATIAGMNVKPTIQASFNQANAAYDAANTKFSSAGGTISGDVFITGNLAVAGNATTFTANNLVINDPFILLANNNTSDVLDIGLAAHYNTNLHTGLFRSAATKEWYLFKNYDAHFFYGDQANIDLSGNNFTLDTINADIRTSNLILGGANAILTIGAAFNQANTARNHANAAFLAANNAVTDFSPAFLTANIAYAHANASFAKANAALSNTSGAAFAGNLNLPTGNLAVGIATANAGAKLQVYNTTGNSELWITADNGYDPVLRMTGEAGATSEGFVIQYDNSVGDTYFKNIFGSVGAFHFQTSVVEAFTIQTDGKVGVGTTNPSHILDVKGVANVSSALLVNDMNVKPTIQAAFNRANSTTYTSNVVISVADNSNAALRITQTGTGDAIRVEDSANPDATCFIVDANGSVGIGTQTPATQLQQFSASFVSRSIGTGTIFNLEVVGGGVVSYGPTTNHPLNLVANNATVIRLDASGNVGIGTLSPNYKLEVAGSFAAQTKSFVINHPTQEGKFLRYGSLEGPENGVYVRGRLEGKSIIELPEYWWNLVDQDTITVNLTPIGRSQDIWVQSTSTHFIHLNQPADCFFTVFAERKDVDKLVVEY